MRVPHLRDGFIVAKVGIARVARPFLFVTPLRSGGICFFSIA
jgi:hypothetical protein